MMTLVSTKDRAGEYDAIATAKAAEPLFPLQGGDPFAIRCVELWVSLAREEAMRLLGAATDEHSKRKSEKMAAEADRLTRKATAAEEVIWSMQEYQRGEDVMPVTEPENADQPDRSAIAIMSGICDRLYNSQAELTEAADALIAYDPNALIAQTLVRDAAISAGRAVQMIEPRRHLQRRAA